MAPRDRASARRGGVEPVLHIVLLGHACRPRVAHVEAAQHVLHLGRRIGVDQEEAPTLCFSRRVWMPDADAARLATMIRGIREYVAGEWQQACLVAEAALPFLEAVLEVFVHGWILRVGRLVLQRRRH